MKKKYQRKNRDNKEDSKKNKRQKKEEDTDSNILVNLDEVREQRDRFKFKKPNLLSDNKISEKRLSAVEDIFKNIEKNEEDVFTEEYSSSDECESSGSLSSSEGVKANIGSSNYSIELKDYKNVNVPSNGNCLFASLDILVFNGEENQWSLSLMVGDFLNYYNCKRIHSTTKMIPRDILFNFKDKDIINQVKENTENSRKEFLQNIDFDVGDSILLTSWISEIPNKRIRSFKREKPRKGTKGERQEIRCIEAKIIKKGLYYSIVEIKKLRVPNKEVKKGEKIKVTYDCMIRI